MLSMADQHKNMQGVRKSGRLYLKRSFSRFTNNKETALDVDDGDFEEPNSVPKVGAVESKSSKQPKGRDDGDFEEPKSVPKVGPVENQSSKQHKGRDLACVDEQPQPKKIKAHQKRKSGDDGCKVVKRKDTGIRLRTTPHALFQTMKDLTIDQRKVVIRMGFESILNMRMDGIPAKLGFYAIDHYNPSEKVIETEGGRIEVTREKVHQLLGIPMGNIKIALSCNDKDEVGPEIEKWRKQFPSKTIRPSHISNMITEQKQSDFNFMLSFIVLFANVIGRCISNGTCYLNLLSQVNPGTDFSKLDWCGYVMHCLADCKKYWRPKASLSLFCGPMTLLVLLYVESMPCKSFKVVSQGLAINTWTMEKLRKREKEERRLGGFGRGEVIDICKKQQADPSVADQNEQMDTHQMILLLDDYMHELEGSIRVILERKSFFEDTMKGAKLIFHDNSRLQNVEETFKNIFNQTGCSDIPDVYEHAPQQEGSKGGAQSVQLIVSPQKTASTDPLSDTQFWVHPSATAELFRNVDELARRVPSPSGQKQARNKFAAAWSSDFSDAPSFSLGLTQEFDEASKQQLTVLNEHCSDDTEYENPEPLDQLQITEPNKVELSNRQPSGGIRSPFIKRKVIELSSISQLETMVSDWVFAMQGDRMEEIFMTEVGQSGPKHVFESFVEDEFLFYDVVDMWSTVLNYEEQFRSPDSHSRLFCGATTMTEEKLLMSVDKIEVSFGLDIISACTYDASMENLHNVDLIFFTIVRREHFYVAVFNLKKPEFIIMDNVAADQEFTERYGILPLKLRDFLVRYLKSTQHPKVNSIRRVKPKRWPLRWRTEANGVNCGIFAMRHMETYMGETLSNYSAGLAEESQGQKMELMALRVKYLTKILLSDINLRRDKVIAEARHFATISAAERHRLKDEAYKTRKDRLTSY